MGLITEESKPDKPGEIMGLGLGRATRREQMDEPPPYSSEITLGMRSMLGIFFGLVLVCGVFFGLGYSVGRNGGLHSSLEEKASQALADLSLKKPSATEQNLTPAPAPAAQNTQAPTNPGQANGGQSNNGTVTETDLGSNNAPDSAGVPPKPAEVPAADSKPPVTAQNAASRPAPAQQVAQKASVVATPGQRPSPSPVTKPAASFSSPYAQPTPQPATQSYTPSGPGNYIVQIAAVRLPQDANILVGALQQRGFTATIRHEGQDQLLHVQVGPFATRAQAYDMRSKLLADGYNAVVK